MSSSTSDPADQTPLTTENVQDYPRPPLLEKVPQRLCVELGGEVVADTTNAWRVCETHHPPTYYIPREDVSARLVPAAGGSFCEWKGRASYWDVATTGKTARRAAWSYAAPTSDFGPIRDHISFYASLMDSCFVGEEKVTPQPGDFYGGWVTANLTGTIKGPPGTRHW